MASRYGALIDESGYEPDGDDQDEDFVEVRDNDGTAPLGASSSSVAGSATNKSFKKGAGLVKTVTSQAISLSSKVSTAAAHVPISSSIVSGAATIAPIAGPAGIAAAAVDAGISGKAALSTYRHIKQLELLLGKYYNNPDVKPSSITGVEYAIAQKNKKLARKKLACLPVVGNAANRLVMTAHSVTKRSTGSRGTRRREIAELLWANQLAHCPLASAACEELLGTEVYKKIESEIDGGKVLKKKLKSI